MTMELDVDVYKRMLESRLARETDSNVQRNLRAAIQHFDREIAGDLEGIMNTLAKEPIYHLYHLANAAGQCLRTEIRGIEAVRRLYQTAIAEGTLMLQELNPRSLIADTNGVAFDASAKLAFSGNWLNELGHDCDRALNYLYEGRLCAFIMINSDGLLTGEDVYFDPTGFEGIVDRPIKGARTDDHRHESTRV